MITVYGAGWCADCRQAKALLDSKGLEYDYRDIDHDPASRAEMLELSDGQNSIPVIVIDDTILIEPDNATLLANLT